METYIQDHQTVDMEVVTFINIPLLSFGAVYKIGNSSNNKNNIDMNVICVLCDSKNGVDMVVFTFINIPIPLVLQNWKLS